MKCPNCGSEMFEEDPGCQKCGWNETSKQYGGTEAVSKGGLGSFFKSAITRPWLPVGDTYGVKVPLTAAFIVLSLTILYIFLWLYYEFDAPSTAASAVPAIPFMTFLVFLAVIFTVFYAITYGMHRVASKGKGSWKGVLGDYSHLSVTVFALFTIMFILLLITGSAMPAIFSFILFIIVYLLVISIPVFVLVINRPGSSTPMIIIMGLIYYLFIIFFFPALMFSFIRSMIGILV